MRRPLIAGNWKLHKTLAEAKDLAQQLVKETKDISDRDIVISPVYTALAVVAEMTKGSTVEVAAQNCYPVASGAYTGEVSAELLKDAGCSYVIIGHSERRQLFGETDEFINSKVAKTIEIGLKPILCIGETLEERESGAMLDVLTRQIKGGLNGLHAEQMAHVVIAYEPVWAIGTGKTATDEQAQEAHSFIRGLIQGMFNPYVAQSTRILYGGSVKPNNVDGLMGMDDIDGALVGGASLKAEDFLRIIKFS